MLRSEPLKLNSELIDGNASMRKLIEPVKNINKADSCFTGAPDEPDLDPDAARLRYETQRLWHIYAGFHPIYGLPTALPILNNYPIDHDC